jgi:glycosyltransferase involved in cell wall biosynthesis
MKSNQMEKLILPNIGISILICTYNPNEQIFERVLSSVKSLKIPIDVSVECIIIDNNSQLSIEQMICVREFLKNCPWAKVIQEPLAGLTFARIAGFQASINNLILFVDDDNQISDSYLQILIDLSEKYPSVAAWGPGTVNVEFMGEVSSWFSNNFKYIFQERHAKYHEYGCVPEAWTSFYPYGTGLAVRREVLDKYCAEFKNGNLCCLDRKGKDLSSGGDVQIVWEAIKMDYAAGVAPTLIVNHLISVNKSNLDYAKRLIFATSASYFVCLVSSFPDLKADTIESIPTTGSILRRVIRKIIRYSIRFQLRLLIVDLADYLGVQSGHYQSVQKNNQILDLMIKLLKLR